MNITGPALVLRHLIDLGAVGVLLAACTAVGLATLARFRVRYYAPLDSLLFGLAVGAAIIATALLELGFAGALRGPTPELTVLVFAAIAARRVKELPALIRGAVGSLTAGAGPVTFAVLGLSTALASFMVLLAVAPPMEWDSLMYHLRVPAQFLERGRIFLPEDNLHVAYVGLAHMLYLPLLRVGSSSAPAVLSAAFAITLGLATFAMASRFWGQKSGLWSLLLLWSSPIILLVAGTARIDVTLGLFLLLAQYALLIALRSQDGTGHLYVGALLAGCALGVKHQAFLYDAALLPLAFVAARTHATSLKSAGKRLGLASALAGIAAMPYLLKNIVLLGGPLYPFFARPALEPWLVPLFQRRTVPAGAAAGAFLALAQVRHHFNLVDAFLHPGRLTIESEGQFYYASPLFLTLLFWPAFRRDRILNWLGLPAVAYVTALVWAFPAMNLRYLIPSLAPLTVVAVVVATGIGSRLPQHVQRLGTPLLAGLALGSSVTAAIGWVSGTRLLAHAVGVASDYQFLSNPHLSAHWRVVQFVNDSLPKNARILEVFEARAYSMERAVLADPRLTNWPLLAATSAPGDCLQSLGITHVLVGYGPLAYYVSRGLDREALHADAFDRFAARCLRPVFEIPGATLYRVTRPTAEGP